MSQSNPVRSALVSFFKTLIAADPHAQYSTIFAAKRHFEAVASKHFDSCASRSDAIYARVISLLDELTPEDLFKVCEGFRQVSVTDLYNSLNAARPAFRAGVRALLYGCENGIEPCAVSYRHNPDASGRTVSQITANRLHTLLTKEVEHYYVAENNCVVWIDRAVKGLSSDGAWFVRGLLPYAAVVVATVHACGADLQRPWIWLEWRMSMLFTTKGPEAVRFEEVLLIALQAMYLPGDVLQKYEYKDEMEDVILDMFLYGLALHTYRKKTVADWSDYKVGLAVSLAFSLLVGDSKWSSVNVDDRNPFGSNLFTCGFANLLRYVGAEIALTDNARAFALVSGKVALVTMKHNQLKVVKRANKEFVARIERVVGKRRLAQHLKEQLRSVSVYCDVNAEFPQHEIETVDELAVLGSCEVTLHEYWRRRTKSDDDVRSATLAEDLVVTVKITFDVDKAVDSSRRKSTYNLKRWWDKTRRGYEHVGHNDGRGTESTTVRHGAVYADFNRGCIRLTTRVGDETVFRRLGRPIGWTTERCSAVFACIRGHVACATAAAHDGDNWRPATRHSVVVVPCGSDGAIRERTAG
eukprot:TRINITY_DN10476_c0_g1_i1.p1 TRINITY_DN10476_c0_g1~~TRINITY_DN10476_c0_g1_i1.p1  ORF type:complete len:582 (-),score=78.57 TRINITY_DN10476_c0_g1_i1:236-1981(-)